MIHSSWEQFTLYESDSLFLREHCFIFKRANHSLIKSKSLSHKELIPASWRANCYCVWNVEKSNPLILLFLKRATRTKEQIPNPCLINIIENIAFCKTNNIAGTVVAIDQAKAFDCLDHSFMREAYSFFGFGDSFIRMLLTLSFDRSSCITLDDNSYSRSFKI